MKKKDYSLNYPRIVAIGFAAIILVGTVLLMLPMSNKTGENASFIDALFTAVSACCVTGLIVFDTFTKWTLFGQLVILVLIQIGGLGFITIGSTMIHFVTKKVGLKEKMLLKESVNAMDYGGVAKLTKHICFGTAGVEIIGAALLCTRYIPAMGFKNGLYTSVFLSVSAFCNAGFDVMGRISPGSSLITVNNDPVIILTIAFLIIIGGIGFLVLNDIARYKFKFKKYHLHSKLVLITTGALLVGGTVLFFLFEKDNSYKNMGPIQATLNAFFSSVTPRTAGFNSVDTSSLTTSSKSLTMFLMFIGGSSGSTAGGIKTTTMLILFLSVASEIRGKADLNIFGKRISPEAIKRATSIVAVNFSLLFVVTFIISNIQPELSFHDVLFESFSAVGTVGMTCGITPSLCTVSKILIAFLMFAGRLTTLTFAMMFTNKKHISDSKKPIEKVIIG